LIRILGHNAAIAHDGPKVIVSARDGRPEHALLDTGLPGMDGYEVTAPLQRTFASRLVGRIATHKRFP
jgi:CheY-like chemotaxis protein